MILCARFLLRFAVTVHLSLSLVAFAATPSAGLPTRPSLNGVALPAPAASRPGSSSPTGNRSTAPAAIAVSPGGDVVAPQGSLSTLNLGRVDLASVIQVVYGEMLKQPFFLDARVKSEPITLSFKGATPDAAARVLDEYLKSVSVRRLVRDGVNVFVPADGEPASPSAHGSAPAGIAGTIDRLGSVDSREAESGEVVRLKHRRPEELQQLVQAVCKTALASSDSFLVMCPPAKVAMVRSIVQAFDTPTTELLVKAAVIEYSDTQDAGAGLFGAIKALGNSLQISIGSPNQLGNYVGIKSSTVEAVLSVAASDSRFNVVHQSTLRVASGKQGRLQVGQDVPILGSVTLDKNGAPLQSVAYRNTGLVVSVKPLLVGDRVQAELDHSVSSFAVTSSSKIDSPTFLTRSINSQLVADLGEVLLIGGLDQSTQSDAKGTVLGLTLNKTGRRDRSTLFLVLQFLKA